MRDETSNELDFTNPGGHSRRGGVPGPLGRTDAPAKDAAIASATASSAASSLSETTVFQPGELSGLLDKSESTLVRGVAKMAAAGSLLRSAPADRHTPAGPEAANVVAIIEWPSGATTQFSTWLNIGRDRGFCPFAAELESDTHVSRRHAVLEACAEGIRVRDLDSRNGTFVDGEKVPGGQAVLVDRDAQIRFGARSIVRLTLKR